MLRILITLAFFSRFRLDKPYAKQKPYKYIGWDFTCKSKKVHEVNYGYCISFMDIQNSLLYDTHVILMAAETHT